VDNRHFTKEKERPHHALLSHAPHPYPRRRLHRGREDSGKEGGGGTLWRWPSVALYALLWRPRATSVRCVLEFVPTVLSWLGALGRAMQVRPAVESDVGAIVELSRRVQDRLTASGSL